MFVATNVAIVHRTILEQIIEEDLGKSSCKPHMNYKFLVVLLYMFGYAMKTEYKNLEFYLFIYFGLLLVIINFQNCFIFLFLSFD